MPSYMPVHDREDRETSEFERIPKSRVVVLEDTNNDGRMDKSHVFMDGLELPRAIKVMDQGLLLAEPPNVWFIRDTTGNGILDAGIYRNIAESEIKWPAHATGVNRGYRINSEVQEDGTLRRSTSTTGPVPDRLSS